MRHVSQVKGHVGGVHVGSHVVGGQVFLHVSASHVGLHVSQVSGGQVSQQVHTYVSHGSGQVSTQVSGQVSQVSAGVVSNGSASLQYPETSRTKVYQMAESLKVSRNTVRRHWRKALEKGILFKPQLRLKMFAEVKEYVYALSSDTAFHEFHELQKDEKVCYEIFATGYADLLLITSEPFSRSELGPLGKVMVSGSRSNYVYPKVPATDYVTAMDYIEGFAQNDFEPSEWVVNYSRREVDWKEIDWKLFRLLRYDMTKTYTELSKLVEMSYDGFRWSLKRILENTQVIVPYYPEGYSQYTRFLFVFQSKYEQMLLDMFSMVPCFTLMYKVKDWFLVHFRILPLDLTDRFFKISYDLQDRGYIDRIKTAFPITHWHPD